MTNLPIPPDDIKDLLTLLTQTVDRSPEDSCCPLPLTEYQAFIIKLLLEDALYGPSTCEKCGTHINFSSPETVCFDCKVAMGQAEYEQ
jgi:hypothetical protein